MYQHDSEKEMISPTRKKKSCLNVFIISEHLKQRKDLQVLISADTLVKQNIGLNTGIRGLKFNGPLD